MKRLFIIFLSLIILFSACKKSDNPVEPTPPNDTGGKIVTGPTVDIATQPISTGGGTIKITKPGDPLDGFELTIPPNSFTQTQNIKVSESPIISHQLGNNFNPISPLIHIEYNGGIANKPMKLKIPVKVTNGKFAMPFIYDKSTGKLIPMLIQEIGTDYIILSTRYFSSNGSLNKTSNLNSLTYADVVVSDIDETKLNAQPIDSKYEPGTDDWEFINWGSYVASGGHCAGQAITSMWYYIEKKMKGGALPLFHLLDKFNDPNKPNFLWQDNPKGYRFAGTIQQDFNFSDWLDEIGDQSKHPDVTFKAFAYSMLITKEPQLVFIAKVSPDTAGHAMVVYKIDYASKKLFIADPNYPNNRTVDGSISERVINYTGNKLGPYTSGATAADLGIVFDRIGYYPKTAYIKWEQIAARWVELEAGIIGQDRFPNYTLYVDKVGGDVLTDNYKTSQQTIRILNRSTESAAYFAGTDRLQLIYVYDDQGNTIGHFGSLATFDGDNYGKYVLDLIKPGINKFGFYIMGGKGNKLDYFVDFKWINIIYNEIQIKINPDPLNGQTNTEYTFSVNLTGTPPSNAKYVWNFGDGTGDVTVQNSTTVKHTFVNEGVYEVKCSLYDNSNNTLLVATHSTANILSAFLMDVLASKSASIFLQADFKSSSDYIGVGNQIQLGNSEARIRINNYIKWNGLSFTTNYVYKIAPYTGTDSVVVTGSVSGTISSDGKMISTFSASERQELKSGTGSWIEQKIDAKDLPYYRTTSISNQYRNTGPSVASNIALVSIRKWTQNPNTQQYELVTLSSVNYNSTSTIPDTYIGLTK